MSNLDEQIREALQAEGAGAAEPQLREMIGDMFRGRLRWLNVVAQVVGLVFTALAVFAAIRFFQAEELRPMLIWAIALVFCLMTVSLMKIWFWLELQKSAILREIKRLELRVAHIGSKPDVR
jgi:hypothetical protein